jgi:hypothetical protein
MSSLTSYIFVPSALKWLYMSKEWNSLEQKIYAFGLGKQRTWDATIWQAITDNPASFFDRPKQATNSYLNFSSARGACMLVKNGLNWNILLTLDFQNIKAFTDADKKGNKFMDCWFKLAMYHRGRSYFTFGP